MHSAICLLSVVPIRASFTHKSEQVSQMLFGETCQILERKLEWFKVKTDFDDYEGWVQRIQLKELVKKEHDLCLQQVGIALEIASNATSTENSIPILLGSSLPQFDGINFRILKEKFIYNGQSVQNEQQLNATFIEKIALKFLHAPYMWGGRSPFGIDCSGFTQIVFKCIGISLKRDAYQQAESGVTVDFIQSAELGDLAFFHNDEGKIIHVGMVLKDQKIIHASGRVRIDTLDHYGIFDAEKKKYSHQLKIIKKGTVNPMKNIVVLTGAGVSAESGISTFRDSGGLWEGHRVEDVASPEGWHRNQQLVLDFYNLRRADVLKAQPNKAHIALVALEKHFNVNIITQNVDDLHERAGSKQVLHLHGELLKVRSQVGKHEVFEWRKDLNKGDTCPLGAQLRPHIVWFGEAVPEIEHAIRLVRKADVCIVIGTSMVVYPAAGLVHEAPSSATVYFVNPDVTAVPRRANLKLIAEKAATGVPALVEQLILEQC